MAQGIGKLPEVLKVGANELELVVFKMYCQIHEGVQETRNYGVNVAKVREIIPMPQLTTVPDMPAYADSLAEVRGEVIPIVDLGQWMKLTVPEGIDIRHKVIVLEMLGTTVGMIVHDVERIRRIKWDKIKPPPPLLQTKHGGKITGVTKIDDGNDLLLILDLESVIQDIGALIPKKTASLDDIKMITKKKLAGNVLIVDDSSVARKILKDILENVGLTVLEAVDGKQALAVLNDFQNKIGDKSITQFIQLVISDVEMPEMDGLTFTKTVKNNLKLKVIPIIVNTSLSGEENKEKAKSVGADGYLVKFDVNNLLSEVNRLLIK
ncbi:MAG: chemotaxis protein [Candidatus Magnetobacterium sp. LHC-1]|uniref:Chemotaxis protein CheV n=1 Tax=Candidatus Magnetobacterium casense TaxID=1455061 RepID=A0ABS6RWV6_9BACT|nr:chemotaxis protein [Candidatus Magnetobacterium casensis]MBF0607778.1 chemotaxis protein CheV [Nitrospirota bacterium]MBV6341106.1 chemotaxis protein CheV [Candidatus Magnetobacterium casensis]